jgi:hypothetical protein
MRLSSASIFALAALVAAPALAQTASPDATLWDSASKGAAGELQLYLGQYPSGQFAAQAKAALAALNAAPAAGTTPANTAAAVSAPSTAPGLKAGWLVEVRATHQQPDSNGQISSLTPWVPDPIALSIRPLQGPDFDIAKLAQDNPAAGILPAAAGSAKFLVQQAGQWGIGADIKWTKTGPCTVTVNVQGNQVINSTTNQVNYFPGSGDASYSDALSLTPGTYDVAWTLVCQHVNGDNFPDADVELSMRVAPPDGALSAPAPGQFVYQPSN